MVELQGYQRYIYRCTPAKVNPLIAHTTTIMKLRHIFRFPGMLAISALIAGMATGVTSCKEDDESISGEPYFYIEGAEDGVVHMDVKGLDQDKWAFGAGDHYIVRSNCPWKIIPIDGEMPEWMKIYPLEGNGEGILRFYAVSNPMAQIRSAEFRVIINGIEMDRHLVLSQNPSGPVLTLTADNLMLQQSGSFSDVIVTANYDWEVVPDQTATWLSVERNENRLTIGTDEPNHSGAERTATVIIRGTGENATITTPITVTQLDAIFFDDFGWCFTPMNTTADFCDEPNLDAVVCWGDQNLRIDKWIDPVKSANPGWTGVRGTKNKSAGPYTYSRHNYILFGTSNKCAGNICSPAIASIEGAINATVSWSMAGFTSAKNAKEKGNEFWVSILGPGRITEVTANGSSTAEVVTGLCTIPYNSTGNTPEGKAGVHDIDLTEAARFYIGKDGYFDVDTDPTGLEVWKNPESMFSMKVDGMTAETRIVFIACDADNLTMETGEGWDVREGNSKYKSNRKLFDNFKVVEN